MTNRPFPIALKGEQTTDVESFASYIYRSSYEHGVKVGVLTSFLYGYCDECHDKSDWRLRVIRFIQPYELVMPNRITRKIVECAEAVTHNNLSPGVLWMFDNIIGQSKHELRHGFQWCPECFAEMDAHGDEPYFKLIWHLTGVKACHVHRTPLLNHCEACGAEQFTHVLKYSMNHCQKCGTKLSYRKARLKKSDLFESWEDIGVDIVKLFEDLAGQPRDVISQNKLHRSLSYLVKYYVDAGRLDKVAALVHKADVRSFMYRWPLSFVAIRRFAYTTGVSLYDLMSGNAELTSLMLEPEWGNDVNPDFMLVHKKEQHNHQAQYKKIKKVIAAAKTPLSLPKLAETSGVSIGYIEYRYPDLVKSVVHAHQEYEAKLMRHKRYEAQRAALKYFSDSQYDAARKSRKHAYKVLHEETGLPKFMLKRAIQAAYEALN